MKSKDEILENPEIPGESQTTPEKLIDNPVVEEALKILTISVNLPSGLTESRYKSMAADLFRILYKNNEKYDPNYIRAWALRNKWPPKGADQLKDVAQAILDRRPIARSKMPVWRKDLIDELRKRAKGTQQK